MAVAQRSWLKSQAVKYEYTPVVVVAAAASPAAAAADCDACASPRQLRNIAAAAHAPPAAPPAAPTGAGPPVKQLTVKQKVERIKDQLGLEATLPITTAVAAALESLGMSQSGNLTTQIDAINSLLGLEG